MPIDKDYIQLAKEENKPLLGYTYTRHNNITTAYVFAFAEADSISKHFSFYTNEIGINGKAVVYNPGLNIISVINADEQFEDNLPADKYAYYIVAPVTASGIAFFGDAGKITATGKKRIADIIQNDKGLQVKVLFAKGEEPITLKGYAEHAVSTDKGKVSFDAASHIFTIVLPAPANESSVTVNIKAR
jgi:hypothetical protein